VNSLHSNPRPGTQSLEYNKSAVLGQAPGIDLSIYHAFLNPSKENESSFQMNSSAWLADGAVAVMVFLAPKDKQKPTAGK